MKILIVSSCPIILESLAATLNYSEIKEIIGSSHEEALEKFLTEEFDFVLICEYDECGNGREEWNAGWQTYSDIKNSAKDESVVRLGFSYYNHDDYMQIPFQVEDLIAKMNKG